MAHTVLVIDDDEMILMTTRRLLEEYGYRVLSTADGPQGIAIYRDEHPDLVLLDLGLPTMNGLDVLREIKALDPVARVIVVTGYGAEESFAAAQRYGVAGYVQKSEPIESLLDRIRSVLGEAGG